MIRNFNTSLVCLVISDLLLNWVMLHRVNVLRYIYSDRELVHGTMQEVSVENRKSSDIGREQNVNACKNISPKAVGGQAYNFRYVRYLTMQ